MSAVEQMKSVPVNRLPMPTYRFLKVNEAELPLPEGAVTCKDPLAGIDLPEGLRVTAGTFAGMEEALREIPTGMGEEADRIFAQAGCPASVLSVQAGVQAAEPVILPVTATVGVSSLAAVTVRAEEDAALEIVIDLTCDAAGCAAARSFFGMSLRILAGDRARVKLVVIRRFGAPMSDLIDLGIRCGEDAAVEYSALSLGVRGGSKAGAGSFQGVLATLAGDRSSFIDHTGYYAGGHGLLDMNIIADHRGRDTRSDMIFRGVLDDHAKKIWRGTLDFKSGAAGSAGNEQEDTLMLSPSVHNSSVPLILCGEEDVDGRHGATIGQLSDEILFYMSSRGYTAEEARRLIVQARLKSVAREIPDAKLRWEVEQWIEREIA